MDFVENLPDNCPPKDAAETGYNPLFRLVASKPARRRDFASQAAQGRKRPNGVDECRWASCSFFTSKEAAMRRLPKPRARFNFIACLSIPNGAGKSKKSKKHVDFWFYVNVNPTQYVTGYESL